MVVRLARASVAALIVCVRVCVCRGGEGGGKTKKGT